MAKVIKYNLLTVVTRQKEKPGSVNADGDDQVEFETWEEEVITPVVLPYSEAAEKLAKREAHNGKYTIEDDGKQKPVTEQITELKNQLTATDYKVIKCAECQLLGEEMPYDVAELHADRQAIRDEINKLEQGE